MKTQCSEIVLQLLDMYSILNDCSPKGTKLFDLLSQNSEKAIALIVPKAYYAELFSTYFQAEGHYSNVTCVTANRFDNSSSYDAIISVGNISGKRFDLIECFSAPSIEVLLYDSESKLFSHRRRKYIQSEKKLNARIKGLQGDDYERAVFPDDSNYEDDAQEETVIEFSDLDDFVDSMGAFDIKRLVSSGTSGAARGGSAEVKFVGTFTTGEQILFSKYYSAVVFDQNVGAITETSPGKLMPGDVLVFTKKNDYTRNIVDMVFDQLLRTNRLSKSVQESAAKASYWKEALREYKVNNGLTFRAVARALNKLGSSLQEVTIRQWLIEESHIVGPRDEDTMRMIGEITEDPYLLSDTHGYFEACREVRHFRREILSLLAQAINDKLSNVRPQPGSIFEAVYENVENLSETLELEKVFELDETVNINNNLVNRPIMETEVLM